MYVCTGVFTCVVMSHCVCVCVQVFSGVFADDPLFVCEVMEQAIALLDQQGARKTGKERQVATLNYCGHVLDAVTCRHRLIDAAWETEILSKVCRMVPLEYIGIHTCFCGDYLHILLFISFDSII